jgi:hypothetical protein
MLQLLVTDTLFLAADSFDPDDGGDMIPLNVSSYKTHTVAHPE